MDRTRIPPSIIGAAAPILAITYTHAALDSLFMASGFPGDPPEGNKEVKCQLWIRPANAETPDPLTLFAALTAEFMDVEPTIARP